MILLTDYEAYWQSILLRIPNIKSFALINNDKDISNFIQNLPAEHPILFASVPWSDMSGNVDSLIDVNVSLLFLLAKSDKQTKGKRPIDVQKYLQPIIEQLKDSIINDSINACSVMANLQISEMHTDPESELYSDLSGWSLKLVF